MVTFGFNRTMLRATQSKLHTMFLKISLSAASNADAVWPSRICNLTPLDYYLWGAIKDKCYADKQKTIDALKDNIRKAIDEIQLHTIDNVLKSWTDRVG